MARQREPFGHAREEEGMAPLLRWALTSGQTCLSSQPGSNVVESSYVSVYYVRILALSMRRH